MRASRASILPPPLRKQGHTIPRDGLTNEQKQELRKWWADDSYGKRKHSDAKAWVKAKWNKDIKKSTLSDALSSKLAWLDNTTLTKYQVTVIKNRKSKWPTLEAVLLEWQIRYDKYSDSGSITGDLLQYKAIEFWGKFPEYTGQECPAWSEGWLAGFKKRSDIKEKRHYGKAGSV